MKKYEFVVDYDDVYNILEIIQKHDIKYSLDGSRYKLHASIIAIPNNKVKITVNEKTKNYIINVLDWDLCQANLDLRQDGWIISYDLKRIEKIKNAVEIEVEDEDEEEAPKYELILDKFDFTGILLLNKKYTELNLSNIIFYAYSMNEVKLHIKEKQINYLLDVASSPLYHEKHNTVPIANVNLIRQIYEAKIRELEKNSSQNNSQNSSQNNSQKKFTKVHRKIHKLTCTHARESL